MKSQPDSRDSIQQEWVDRIFKSTGTAAAMRVPKRCSVVGTGGEEWMVQVGRGRPRVRRMGTLGRTRCGQFLFGDDGGGVGDGDRLGVCSPKDHAVGDAKSVAEEMGLFEDVGDEGLAGVAEHEGGDFGARGKLHGDLDAGCR